MNVPDVTSELTRDRIAVSIALSRFRRRWESERLEMYRRHLQVAIVSASPLVAEVDRLPDGDVARQMWRLRPPFGWPEGGGPCGGRGHFVRLSGSFAATRDSVRRAGSTVVIRTASRQVGPVTLRIGKGVVELSTTIGEVYLRTEGGIARLRLPFRLPDRLAAAAAGQPVERLVGHPWFAGRNWPIRLVVDRGPVHEIVVATGLIAFEMPWRRILARAPAEVRAAGSGS